MRYFMALLLMVSIPGFSLTNGEWDLPKGISDRDAEMVARGYKIGFEAVIVMLQAKSRVDVASTDKEKLDAEKYKKALSLVSDVYAKLFRKAMFYQRLTFQSYADMQPDEIYSIYHWGDLKDAMMGL